MSSKGVMSFESANRCGSPAMKLRPRRRRHVLDVHGVRWIRVEEGLDLLRVDVGANPDPEVVPVLDDLLARFRRWETDDAGLLRWGRLQRYRG